MPEDDATELDRAVTIVCPMCQDLFEFRDVRALLLAIHIDEQCAETRGVTHE